MTKTQSPGKLQAALDNNLQFLKLLFIKSNCQSFALSAANNHAPHLDYLASLIEGEVLSKQDRACASRLLRARFPILKTLDQFQWTWPKKIDRLQLQSFFRLDFIGAHANVILLGGVGLGKTHLSIALGYAACQAGHSVLFTTAIDAVQALIAARAAGRLKQELRKFTKPDLLVLDELGFLPIDKVGADLLFQIISQRYECGSIVITSNRVYKHWSEIFNNDSTLTSAILDRLLHHAETSIIEGKSFRAKDSIDQ